MRGVRKLRKIKLKRANSWGREARFTSQTLVSLSFFFSRDFVFHVTYDGLSETGRTTRSLFIEKKDSQLHEPTKRKETKLAYLEEDWKDENKKHGVVKAWNLFRGK